MGVKNTNPDKNPRKSFFYYYGIVLLVVFLLNTFLVPSMMGRSVKEVSYDQFLHFVEANQENGIFTLKYSRKNWPRGRFTPRRYRRKKPATVGGSTRGRVKSPSTTARHTGLFRLTTSQAARIPRKNVITMETLAVFMEISTGDQSICPSSLAAFKWLLFTGGIFLSGHAGQEASGVRPSLLLPVRGGESVFPKYSGSPILFQITYCV